MRKDLQLPGLTPNSKYAVQIRGIDADGNPGLWSSQYQFETVVDQVAPAQPNGLTVVIDDSNFVIEWEPVTANEDGSPLDDLRDYVVRLDNGVRTVSHNITDNQLLFTLTMNRQAFGTPQPALDVQVYARDRVGNLSTPAELSVTKSVPVEHALIATAKRNAIELRWSDEQEHLARFEIHKNGDLVATVGGSTFTWTDTDVGSGAQTYVVRAVDYFGQHSNSNPVTEGEISLGDLDNTAPKPPTGLSMNEIAWDMQTIVELSWHAPTQDTDDTSYTDHEGYQVRHRTSAGRPYNYLTVADDRAQGVDPQIFSADVTTQPGASLEWGVRAFDRSGNYSTWATQTDDVALDDTVPNKPSQPVVAGNLQNLQVRHDLRDVSGDLLPSSVQRLDIHVSDDPLFEPDDSTLVGRASVNRLIRMGLPLVWSSAYEVTDENQERYVRVVAVTSYPQFSPASDVVGPELIKLVQSIHIEDATITDAKIADLSATKLTAGSAFINDLDIESKITVNPDGSIESTNFDYDARTGWALDQGNLYMFDGEIDASIIRLQQGANLIDQGYTMFAYPLEWYSNNITIVTDSFETASNAAATLSSQWSRYGYTSLRLQTVSYSTANMLFTGELNTPSRYMRLEPGQRYIVSMYVHNPGGTATVSFIRHHPNGGIVTIGSDTINAGATKRITAYFTMPANQEFAVIGLRTSSIVNLYIDGVQIERRIGDSTEPSFFKTGGITTLDAGQISTGTINVDRIGGNSIPVVKLQSDMQSDNYVPGPTNLGGQGWAINRETGNVEFNDGTFRGDIIGGTISIGNAKRFNVDSVGNMWIGNEDWYESPFRVTADGLLYAVDGYFEGTIQSATILGGTISIGTNAFNIDSLGRLWMGGSSFTNANFRVNNNGSMRAETGTFSGSISGASGSWDNGNIRLDNNGLRLQVYSGGGFSGTFGAVRFMNGLSDEWGRLVHTASQLALISWNETISIQSPGASIFARSDSSIWLQGQSVQFGPGGSGDNMLEFQDKSTGSSFPTIRPVVDGQGLLGGPTRRWNTVYATNQFINTSDMRAKKTARGLNRAEMVDAAKHITALRYRMNGEPDDGPEHFGFDAQQIKDVMLARGINFAGVYDPKDDPTPLPPVVVGYSDDGEQMTVPVDPDDVMMGLSYTELIPILWEWVADLSDKLDQLQAS